MTVNELIEQLKNLPKEVRERPIMDGNPNDEYWLADLRAISVAKVVVSGDGACNMYDPVLSDEETSKNWKQIRHVNACRTSGIGVLQLR